MAGSFRLAVSRHKVETSDGHEWSNMTVTVRDGTAQVRDGRNVVAEMQVDDFEVVGRRSYRIDGVDGTVWNVTRKGCGCGSR